MCSVVTCFGNRRTLLTALTCRTNCKSVSVSTNVGIVPCVTTSQQHVVTFNFFPQNTEQDVSPNIIVDSCKWGVWLSISLK